ncbi:hypothetical protein [Pseudogemmobacter faecipullorum]|uniref:O-antigen polymerase n=1 Tax=Pseudogemmobacter faecipullorum TaxID=2755041 RepID=A0ABS8CNP4_9RHOB|nr:hypothetical protein [Pseudogemmobacter faecipullorum]MCB5410820.1 hypothetical protein [Pseudogemmobacter faecipullorum]
MSFALLWLLQAGFVLATWAVLGLRSQGELLYRLGHAGGFYAFFYLLFFLLPQLVGALSGQWAIIGYEAAHELSRKGVFLATQARLTGFSAAVFIGAALMARWLPLPVTRFHRLCPLPLPQTLQIYLWLCFGFGLCGHAVLAWQSLSLTGFRSDLLKSPSGMALTALSFQAGFAFALLLATGLLQGRRGQALLLIALLAPLVVIQGARGRLLWPLLIAALLIACWRNRLPLWRWLGLGALLSGLLAVMDPLRYAVLRGLSPDISLLRELSQIFLARTFDGFASFALILDGGRMQADPQLLFSGIRDDFMRAYYPEVLAQGVAFGSGLPGWFWLSGGGAAGFLALSLVYGLFLGLLALLLRRLRHLFLVVALLFCCIWLCALAGDFVESLDKMLASCFAGLLGALLIPARAGPAGARRHFG